MSLRHGDLGGTIKPLITIDEFEPKAGTEQDIIVVGFYFSDKEPAEDMNTFIQRGFIDIVDVDVSPNTDEQGRYMVFVEMHRDRMFKDKFQGLIEDISNLTGQQRWKVTTYLTGDREFDLDDPELFTHVMIDPTAYMTRDEYNKKVSNSSEETLREFFRNSNLQTLTLSNNTVILQHNSKSIIAEYVDLGETIEIMRRNWLTESKINIGYDEPIEARALQSMIGTMSVSSIANGYTVIESDTGNAVLLKNVTIQY